MSPRVFVAGDPVAQGSKRWLGPKKVVESSSKTLAPWRSKIGDKLAEAVGELPPIRSVPVVVSIRFLFSRPKGHLRKDGFARPSAPRLPAVRPDLDKLVRAVLDEMTGVVFVDDGQVTGLNCGKEYTNGKPGAEIRWDVIA